jgi:hypothetical protein
MDLLIAALGATPKTNKLTHFRRIPGILGTLWP